MDYLDSIEIYQKRNITQLSTGRHGLSDYTACHSKVANLYYEGIENMQKDTKK